MRRHGSFIALPLFLALLLMGGASAAGRQLPYAAPVIGVSVILLTMVAMYAISPTLVLFGGRSRPLDAVIAILLIALSGREAAALLGSAIDGTVPGVAVVLSMLLILLVSVWSSVSRVVERQSMLSALGSRGDASRLRPLLVALALLASGTLVVQPILTVSSAIGHAGLAALGVLGVALILAHAGALGRRPASSARHVVAFGAKVRDLFRGQRTVLLGISLLLLVPFTIDTLLWSLPAGVASLLAAISLPDHWMVFLGLFGLVGAVILCVLPIRIWLTLVRLRGEGGREHLPDWSPLAIAVSSACIVAAFLLPGVGVQRWFLAEGVVPVTDAVAALLIVGTVLVATAIAAFASDRLRRTLMAGPFILCVIFLGAYAYAAFVTAFSGLSAVLASTQAVPLLVPMAAVISCVSVLFPIAGFLTFLYEIWRD